MNSMREVLQEIIDHQAQVKYHIQWNEEPIAESPAFTLHHYDLGAVDHKWTIRSVIGICETFTSRKKAEERLKQIFSTAKEKHCKVWTFEGKTRKVFFEN